MTTLHKAVKVIADSVEKLAFEMPAPNPYTPRFVMLVIALREALAQQGEPVAPEQVEAAWRAGWAACRDAEYVGKEAEDEAWGMSQTCANADWENAGAAPAAQPNAIGCTCSVCGEWQRWTPSGMVCKNGHGGVKGINHRLFSAAPQPDARKVIEQMVEALEFIRQWGEPAQGVEKRDAAIQAGQKWLGELK